MSLKGEERARTQFIQRAAAMVGCRFSIELVYRERAKTQRRRRPDHRLRQGRQDSSRATAGIGGYTPARLRGDAGEDDPVFRSQKHSRKVNAVAPFEFPFTDLMVFAVLGHRQWHAGVVTGLLRHPAIRSGVCRLAGTLPGYDRWQGTNPGSVLGVPRWAAPRLSRRASLTLSEDYKSEVRAKVNHALTSTSPESFRLSRWAGVLGRMRYRSERSWCVNPLLSNNPGIWLCRRNGHGEVPWPWRSIGYSAANTVDGEHGSAVKSAGRPRV